MMRRALPSNLSCALSVKTVVSSAACFKAVDAMTIVRFKPPLVIRFD